VADGSQAGEADATDAGGYVPTLLDHAEDFFVGLSPAWLLVDTILLVAAALWLARRALPLYRILRALQTAPLATVRSGASGTVKLAGHAWPGSDHAPSSLTNTPYVWCVTGKFDSRSSIGGGRSGSYSVAPMLVRDATGECVVDPREATVVPTIVQGKTDRHIFSGSTSVVERLIRPGDPVIAIGELRSAKEKANPRAPASCRLGKPKGGVLLVSGKSERRTLVRFHLLFWPAALAAAFCALLGLRGFFAHVQSYPDESLLAYLEALTTRPGQSYPGPQTGMKQE
jgi:hypothetical protein